MIEGKNLWRREAGPGAPGDALLLHHSFPDYASTSPLPFR
jgi:hypothetical protein